MLQKKYRKSIIMVLQEKLFIDPSGGPFMQVGGILKGNKIKAIDYSYDIEAYVITFE